MTAKRPQRTEGAVVEIPLDGKRRAFGRLLREPLIEFYDLDAQSSEPIGTETITSTPVAFKIWVMNSAVTSGRWRNFGKKSLAEAERRTVVKFCLEDALAGKLSIYWSDPTSGATHEVPASREECGELEPAAVWSAEHVEDRLRDHFDGRLSK